MYDFAGRERCEVLAEYVIDNDATVRSAAKYFGMSKSTVHKDLAYKLRFYNSRLYNEVRKILELNKSERHLRGGEATRKKYLSKKTKVQFEPLFIWFLRFLFSSFKSLISLLLNTNSTDKIVQIAKNRKNELDYTFHCRAIRSCDDILPR